MPNYWVGGSHFGGVDDQYDRFINRGYWFAWGPGDESPDDLKEKFKQISINDRIAIKRIMGLGRGHGAKEIEIRAIGIVKDIDLTEWRIYINWVQKDMERKVPIKGCIASLHGPYDESDTWIHSIFHI